MLAGNGKSVNFPMLGGRMYNKFSIREELGKIAFLIHFWLTFDLSCAVFSRWDLLHNPTNHFAVVFTPNPRRMK